MGRAVIGYFRAAHPFPSFLVATVAAALGLIASGGEERGVAAMLGVGMLLYQFAIGTLNDVVDAEDDRRAKPSKPIASGAISRRGAAWLVVVYAGGGMALTAGLPNGGWFVGVAGLLMGVVYDLRLKRTALSWLPLSLALPMVPVWAFVSVGEWEDFLWFVFPLGAVLGFALQLANQAPDVETGGASELGWPGLMGGRRARVVAVAAWVAGVVGVI
ncbi:MAG: UbiA family prenyltransferase, partial [Tepidiformaceae bacterium]